MKTFPVRKFSGIETKFSSEDQDRGTLRRADGVVCVPNGALTTGPSWAAAWGLDTLGASITTALSGADAAKVHFVTVAKGGHTLLIAWDLAASRPRMIAHVEGVGDPTFGTSGGTTISAPATSVYRDKTAALPWYANPIDSRWFIGNGTDANLVWTGGALAVLGPTSTPLQAHDPSRETFPPCIAFCQDEQGVIYGAGNVTYPLRIWHSDMPAIAYPQLTGIRAQATSYREVVAPSGTLITALRMVDSYRVAVHLNNAGPAILIPARDSNPGGVTRPATDHASAITPNCVRDKKQHPFYLGTDLEVYRIQKVAPGDDATDWRDQRLATDRSSGAWNAVLAKPASGGDYFTVYDDKNGRLWLWATLNSTTGSRQALYCYDERAFAVTGPWKYPDFRAVTRIRDDSAAGCIAVGITLDGALLYADMANIGELALPAYSDAIGADYAEFASAGAAGSSTGIPTVGVSADGLQFKQILNGQTLSMATPWSDFAVADVTCTKFYKNAHLVVIEPSLEDFGDVAGAKDILEILLNWRRNQRAYVGVYVECEGVTDGRWLGAGYPEAQQVFPILCKGATLRIRIVAVCFNASQAYLSGLAVGYLPGVR